MKKTSDIAEADRKAAAEKALRDAQSHLQGTSEVRQDVGKRTHRLRIERGRNHFAPAIVEWLNDGSK